MPEKGTTHHPKAPERVVSSVQVFTYCELVEAQHVHDANLGNDRPKQVWTLIGAGCHQQAAIRPSLHIQSD